MQVLQDISSFRGLIKWKNSGSLTVMLGCLYLSIMTSSNYSTQTITVWSICVVQLCVSVLMDKLKRGTWSMRRGEKKQNLQSEWGNDWPDFIFGQLKSTINYISPTNGESVLELHSSLPSQQSSFTQITYIGNSVPLKKIILWLFHFAVHQSFYSSEYTEKRKLLTNLIQKWLQLVTQRICLKKKSNYNKQLVQNVTIPLHCPCPQSKTYYDHNHAVTRISSNSFSNSSRCQIVLSSIKKLMNSCKGQDGVLFWRTQRGVESVLSVRELK